MKISILSLLFLLLGFGISAQTNLVVRDLETWTSVGINAKLGKKWSLTINEQLRLQHNSTIIDELFTEAELKYTLIDKRLKLASGYRFISEYDSEDVFNKEQRFDFDILYYQPLNRFDLSARLRYQNRNDIGETARSGDYARQHYRLKLQVGYDIKNWKCDPTFSVELFRKFERYTLPYFDDIRFRIGTDYKIKKIGEIEVFYQFDYSLGLEYPKTTHVIGLNYQYNLGNIFNKKSK